MMVSTTNNQVPQTLKPRTLRMGSVNSRVIYRGDVTGGNMTIPVRRVSLGDEAVCIVVSGTLLGGTALPLLVGEWRDSGVCLLSLV